MADALDSKSSSRKRVRVQVPPPVLHKALSDKDFRQRLNLYANTSLSPDLVNFTGFHRNGTQEGLLRSSGGRAVGAEVKPVKLRRNGRLRWLQEAVAKSNQAAVGGSWASRFESSVTVAQSLASIAARN